ncbi:hypothetical protein C8J57DRAFT_1716996 [Mycena rebaudengoi]|nr:hypothetical protein C8J57DRAFT_1716996 [Mycena rebaudengoi]
MDFLWLLALALPYTVIAVAQNHTIDDTSPLVEYYQGRHCSPCPDEFKNYGLDPAQLSNGTFSAFENNVSGFVGTQDNGLRLTFTGTAVYVYLAVPAAANLSTPIKCSFTLDSLHEDGADFSMDSPEVNQYNVLAYAKTGIKDGSHILNMDVGNTPVVFDYAYFTSNLDSDPPTSGSTVAISSVVMIFSAASTLTGPAPFAPISTTTMISAAATTSSPAILTSLSTSTNTISTAAITSSPTISTSSSPNKAPSIPLIAGAAAVGAALILALFVGFLFYHRARRTKADAPGMEEWGSMAGLVIPRGDRDGLVGNGGIQNHRGSAGAAQLQQNQSGREVPLGQLTENVQRWERTTNGTRSDIASLVSTSMEGSSAETWESASRARSLSMMKRDQIRALQDDERGVGVGVSDTLVHTDSGLRLTAGRVVDEVPPSYVVD